MKHEFDPFTVAQATCATTIQRLENLMNLVKASGILGLITVAAIASPVALADDAGWYAGANVGQSRATIDNERIIARLLGNGFTTTSIDDHDRDIGFKAFAGYQVNKYFALEGGYFDLGKFGYTATTSPIGTLSGNLKAHGLNLDLVGILPFTDKFSAFGRAGVTYAKVRDSFAGTGLVQVSDPHPSAQGSNYKFGLGLQYALSDSLGLRTEVERYRINDAVGGKGDVDLVSVGLIYRFGAKTTQPVIREPLPEPTVAEPMPEPVAVAPPPPVKKVSFSADSLFDFNKSTMKSGGKQEVEKLAADLKGAQFDVITVTGHTDRIGSHNYNMNPCE